MPRKKLDRDYWECRCHDLSRAYGNIKLWRDLVRNTGAANAADAISRALKSLDGAIRHAQRMRTATEYAEVTK